MPSPPPPPDRADAWRGIRRGQRSRPLEWVVERLIFLVSLTAITMVFLIFLFVAREAAPIFLGRVNSAAVLERKAPLSLDELGRLSPEEVRRNLDLTAEEFQRMPPAWIRELALFRHEKHLEETRNADKDAGINTVAWRHLLLPHQWSDYDRPEFIWQPVSTIHKYNIVPLFIGSLKTTLVALLFAVPLALAAAIYVSQLANPRLKEWLKPAIEMLSAVPTVVLGAFALLVVASLLQQAFGLEYRLNALLAGLALGVASIPVVFSIAEDAITSVPRSYYQGALALGASKWRATWQIVVPAALPGLFAAVVLGFGRCLGETMIVLLASGNAAIVSASLVDPARTVTATIAAELGETVVGGHHYRMLFVLGTLLFAITFVSNLAGDLVMHRLKRRLEGAR
ncbi:MAG: phosphate ABC transporter permease subunit PstC [Limisphaerales bacterium]